jgi:hypothetical protein
MLLIYPHTRLLAIASANRENIVLNNRKSMEDGGAYNLVFFLLLSLSKAGKMLAQDIGLNHAVCTKKKR